MTTAVALDGRLPGVRCDPARPAPTDATIRLDVAGFVGFAQRGPLDDPQPVEDPEQYSAVFGGDVALAIDGAGTPAYAALPTAVQSFFDNGGRRAYVVRVARDPVTHAAAAVVRPRIPLGSGQAVVALDGWTAPPVDGGAPAGHWTLPAATPGAWGRHLAVEAIVRDTVLTIETTTTGPRLAAGSRLLVDEGDAVLVWRAPQWLLLWAPPPPAVVAPVDGWQPGDVARLLRADLTVRVTAPDEPSRVVEAFAGLRLGPGRGRAAAWTDVLQPVDGFRRDRSMYLRVPTAFVGGQPVAVTTLVPVLGDAVPNTDAPGSSPLEPAEPIGPLAAAREDGLGEFDGPAFFLDAGLRGHTVAGLRTELELAALDGGTRRHGIHALALVEDVSVIAVPDLYHRPWHEQAVVVDPGPEPPAPDPPAPVGFHPCPPTADGYGRDVEAPPEVVPPAELRLVVDPSDAYDPRGLHDVSRELATLCAARADVIAVLGLPQHAGLADADDLADVVRAVPGAPGDVASHVGLWHPWGAVVERLTPHGAPTRPVPPVGAVAGLIAASELARGWWVEAAGRRLDGYVDADVADATTTLALFDRGMNALRRRPDGFAPTSAHSLSTDRALLQLSVRRLLIWVRKLALREGTRFVFEPDDERLRAQVRAGFRRALAGLVVAGALHAYDVVVEPSAGRPVADDGRLRVDLKLAPTSPIEFITVTLLRSGDGLVTVAGA